MHPFLTFWLNIALDLRQMRDYRLVELVPQVVKNFDLRALKNQEVAKGHSSRQKLPVLEVYISFTSSLFILGLEFRIYVVMKYEVQVMYEILLMFSCLLYIGQVRYNSCSLIGVLIQLSCTCIS